MSSRTFVPMALGLLLAAAFPLKAQEQPPPGPIEQIPSNLETPPQPAGYENEIYCFGYIAPPRQRFLATISGAESVGEEMDFMTNDILFIDHGADAGIKAGDEFWIIVPQDEVDHPRTGRPLGQFYSRRGRVRVLCAFEHSAVVQVLEACTAIPIGAGLIPFEPIPIPLVRRTLQKTVCDAPNGKPVGTIVYTRDGVVAFTQDYDVIVDLGAANGLVPGDFVTIFRNATGRYGPRTILGEGAVLTVDDHTSTVRVTEAAHVMQLGDLVELK
jgi:hypothetical protein